MDERVECAIHGCLKPPAALLGGQFYCRGHFVASCYDRLDFCADLLRTRAFTDKMSDEMRKFVSECILQAARLSETANNLNNIERARLLDILFYATDLGTQMRRSPRKTLTIPVRVHCKTPSHPWEEDTITRVISRLGAMLECRHEIKSNDILVVEQIESSRWVNARLVWCWHSRSGSYVAGIEFLDCNNFWGLDWSEPQANPVAADNTHSENLLPSANSVRS